MSNFFSPFFVVCVGSLVETVENCLLFVCVEESLFFAFFFEFIPNIHSDTNKNIR